MDHPTNFDPPEAVVPVAFRELLERLRRARMTSTKPTTISDDERKAFEYGVQQRRRVLEHTLFLVFGQWALYRQAVSKLQSRGLRLLYGTGSVLSTVAFVRHRASLVSADMFAHIVTTGVDSPLGNEARIVLAELEGPEGPYFRRVCRERDFQTDLVAAVAEMDESGDPVQDVHPQLRLRPRLQVDEPSQPTISSGSGISRDARYGRDAQSERNGRPRGPKFMRPGPREQNTRGEWRDRREGTEERGKESGLKPEPYSPGWDLSETAEAARSLSGEGREYREGVVEKARERKKEYFNGQTPEKETKEEEEWGRPFDFAEAAAPAADYGEIEDTLTDDYASMSPSQRRAAERRDRRMRAQAKKDQDEREDGGSDGWRRW